MIQIIMKFIKRNWSLHKKYLIQLMNIQLYLKTKHFWHLLDGVQLKKRYFYGPKKVEMHQIVEASFML
jgi:hypothetical protein